MFLSGGFHILTPSGQYLWSAGFDREASHIFPQGVLTTVTLIGAGTGMEWLVLESGVRRYFPSTQWLPLPHPEQGPIPSCWSRSLEGTSLLRFL